MFTIIIDIFNPDIIYDKVYVVFKYYMYLIPIMFGLSFAARLAEEGANSIGGDADYAKAFKDAFVSAVIVFSYGVTAIGVFKLIFIIKDYVGHLGSFGIILDKYCDSINALNAAAEKAAEAQEGWGWGLNKLYNLVSLPVEAIAACCFSVTYAILMMVHLFLRYAYAVMFCFLFTWGGISIATSPSTVLSLKGGFVTTLKGLIVWPIISSVFYVLAGLMINEAGARLLDLVSPTASSVESLNFATAYFVFSFINIFLTAVVISSAFVALYLSQNQSAMAGLLAPFVMGGMTAGTMIRKVSMSSTRFTASKTGAIGKKIGSKIGNRMSSVIGNIIKSQK